MTRARNRELLALIPVALLLTAGFAAVFAQESSKLGNLSVTYGAYFLAICVATHVYLRIRLPNADPYLFPLMAVLTAFGLVMLYRIDEGLARNQANWFVFGLILNAGSIPGESDTHLLTGLEGIPGAVIGMAVVWFLGVRQERTAGAAAH